MKMLTIRVLVVALAAGVAGCLGPTAAQKAEMEAWRQRLQTAQAMFQERCKKAGVKIYRTAENVEGVFLLKLRPQGINYDNQFRLDDPYGRDLSGDGYIVSLLRGSYQAQTRGTPAPGSPPRLGYLYVEAVDPKDGKRYQYTGSIKEVTRVTAISLGGDGKTTFKTMAYVLDRVLAPGLPPRYGITYDDISTREEREYWIAGSSLRILDLQSNEVMAERIGYMMDPGQGSTAGGRAPWLLAARNACPSFGSRSVAQIGQTQAFVEKVLTPRLEK